MLRPAGRLAKWGGDHFSHLAAAYRPNMLSVEQLLATYSMIHLKRGAHAKVGDAGVATAVADCLLGMPCADLDSALSLP